MDSSGTVLAVAGVVVTIIVALFGDNLMSRLKQATSLAERHRQQKKRRPIARLDAYRVGVFPYPPLNFRDDGKGFEGPWARLIEALANQLGFKIELELLDVSKFRDASRVDVDIVVGLFDTPRRREAFDFSNPVHRVGLQGICLLDKPQITVADLSSGNLRILVQGGEVGWEFATDRFKRADENHNLRPFDTLMTSEVHQYIEKGFDVAITDEASCLRFLRDHPAGVKYKLAFERPLNIYDACLAIKKRLRVDMNEINRALESIRNDPAFREYEKKMLVGYEGAIEPYGLTG